MGRKKKAVEEKKTDEQKPEVKKPEEKKEKKEEELPMKQMSFPEAASAPVPVVIPIFKEPETPVSLDWLREEGKKWAEECGLKPPLMVTGPDRIDYPRYGYGYSMTVKEETGKQRLGTARFDQFGARSYWSIDGIVTG